MAAATQAAAPEQPAAAAEVGQRSKAVQLTLPQLRGQFPRRSQLVRLGRLLSSVLLLAVQQGLQH
jgi:hypothetical protein